MRRWLALVAIFGLAGSALAGCSKAAGTDGDLTNGWALPPKPAEFRPGVGTCFDDVTSTAGLHDYAPIACTDRHVTESYYVGTLTGAAAGADAADRVDGSAAQQAAGLECAQRASAYAGGDFRAAELTVRPVLPTAKAWAGGARWFRCDLLQVSIGADSAVARVGTLKNLLATSAGAALKLTCFNPVLKSSRIDTMTPAACSAEHHAEYAGLWAPRNPPQAQLDGDASSEAGCRAVIAKFANVPDDGNLKYRTGWIAFSPTPDEWNAGIRNVRCFLWLDDEAITGSYRNAGTSKLKIAYA